LKFVFRSGTREAGTRKPLRLLKRRVLYSGRVVRLEKLKLRAPDGTAVTRELIRHGGSVVVVPLLKGERFVMVIQYRVATNGYLLEFPAGTLEPGETPRRCAFRELAEEIKYRPGRMIYLGKFFPVPGISTELMHLYLGIDLKPADGHPDEDEWLESCVLTRAQLERQIARGRLYDAKSILGYFYYLRYLKQQR